MIAINNNLKGTIGELRVSLELLNNGWEVFLPVSDFSPIDLIAYNNYKTVRIQVKYRKLDTRGIIEIPFSSVVNGKKVPIDKLNIDYTAVVSDDLPYIVYIPTELILDRKVISFRPSTLAQRSEFWRVNQIGI